MEKNKMEEQNNPNLENTGSEVEETTEPQVVAEHKETTEPKAKKPFPKLAVIIGAAVAGVALIALLLVLLLGGSKNVDIAIKENAMPQAVFVLGEEIDLSAGILLVNDNGNTVEVAMNAEGVTVSGYDKNTLGQQTITISYMDKSVELTVNVVERMQVSDYTADYLIGDAFDLANGRLKITRNDGSNYTVMLKSDKVTVTGFSSESAGQKTVTVQYTSGSETYTTSVKVNVHAVEKVDLTRPTKITYNSHDEGVAVAGGILTLSALDGKIKREITVTEDMIEGFDLSAANKTNSPLTQTVNVMYGGKAYSYDIRITYTPVSEFKDNAQVVAGLDWTKEEAPEISELQGDTAVDMMRLYLDMSPAEQSLLTREETLNMARTAIVYAFDIWGNDVLEFDGAFGVEAGEFVLYAENEEAIAKAVELLADTDRPLFTYYDVIYGIVSTFGTEENDETVYEGAYFSYYPTFDPELFEELSDVFEYMLELDELMDAVGSDWRENIDQYADEIEAVYDSMINGDYYSYDYAQFFIYVSLWREGDDAFDFLYHYYFDVLGDAESVIMIANLRLPSKLEEIFVYIYEAMNQLEYISNYYTADTTQFFYNYFMAVDLSNDLLLSEDPDDAMLKVLFQGLPLNSMLGISAEDGLYTFYDMIDYLCTVDGGYYALCGALLGNPNFEALFDQYLYIIMTLFDNYSEDEFGEVINSYENSAEYIADIKDMLALYMELSPAEQFFFIGTLNAYYSMSIPPYAFDTTGEYADFIAIFFDMVNEVYMDMFETEVGKEAYLCLMIATEAYAQRYNVESWLEEFKGCFEYIAEALEGTDMSDADKALFMLELGDIYNKYLALLPATDGEGSDTGIDLGEWADEFEELEKVVINLELAYALMNEGATYYSLFFSAYERAQELANLILTEAPDYIKDYFIYNETYSLSALDKILDPELVVEDEQFWTYDYVITFYRAIYINALIAFSDGVYDYYMEYDMPAFMAAAYDLYWNYLWEGELNKDHLNNIMAKFRELHPDAQVIFLFYFEGEDGLYYQAIDEFVSTNYESDAVTSAVSSLFEVEMQYVLFDYYYSYYYAYYESEQITKEDFDSIVAEIITDLNDAYETFSEAYDDLGDDEALFTQDFGSMYEYYKEAIEALLAEYGSLVA